MTQAKLASRASDLKRQIYASLPFRYRVAQLLFRLKIADDFLKRNFGRAIYAEFIRAGVTDMPNVGGEPALNIREIILKLKERGANILPSGFGNMFGNEMWMVASKYVDNPEAIADVLQSVMVEVYNRNKRGTDNKLQAVSSSSAESYIKWLVSKRAQDWRRKFDKSKPFSLPYPDRAVPDLLDVKALKGFLHMLSPGDANKFKQDVDRIDSRNPDRPWSFIEGVLEGRSNTEIAKDWGVDKARLSQLLKRWQPELQRIFRKYVEDQDYATAM